MKSPVTLLFLLFCSPVFARDFRPECSLENMAAEDESVRQCYVIKTTPGLYYTLEVCGDLTGWTEAGGFYGIGQEQVVTMREQAPPPPGTAPPPETPSSGPSTPLIYASVRMQPSSGGTGGTVVSWRSLDHGGPVVVRIAGEMDPAWDQVPIFAIATVRIVSL